MSEDNVAAVDLVVDALGNVGGHLVSVLGILVPDNAAGVSSFRKDREEKVVVLDYANVSCGRRS
mgnify:CR=1 FL=1